MNSIHNPTILEALHDKGCVLVDGTISRDAIATALATELEANHIAHSTENVDDVAVSPGQLALDVFTVADPELTKLVGSLLSPGLTGKVQTALADGAVLCATRSKILVDLPGAEQKTITISTRFLSDDPDTIAQYLLDPVARRTVNTAKRTAKLGDLVKDRRPEMVDRVDEWAGQLQISFQTALTAGSDA